MEISSEDISRLPHISSHYRVYFKWFHISSHYQIRHPGTFQLVLLLLFLQYNVHPGHAKEKGRDGEVGLQVNIRRISRPLERHGPYWRAGPIYGTHSLMPHVPSHIPSCLYRHMLVVRPMKREVQRVPLILRSDCLVH